MVIRTVPRWEKQKKAKIGDEVTITGDSRTYIKYSKIHNGHKARIIGGKQKIAPAGLSIKWHYQVQCNCNDSTEWVTANGFKK